MKTTTIEEFQQEILATGGYRTKDDHLAPKRAKKSWWTTLKYSCAVSSVFPKCAIFEPLGKLDQKLWGKFCFSAVTGAEKLGMRVIVEGFEHRNAYKGPVLYLCNHMSTTETIVLPTILLSWGPISYVAKASLGHLPGLEKAADHMGMVCVGRKSPREDLMHILKVGAERLGRGDSFLIFPQGSRERVFSRKLYSSLGAKLAEKANVPVVPIVVDTRSQVRRDAGLLKHIFTDFGPVDTSYDIKVCAGPVIPAGKSKVLHEAAFDWMAGKLEEWGMPVER